MTYETKNMYYISRNIYESSDSQCSRTLLNVEVVMEMT